MVPKSASGAHFEKMRYMLAKNRDFGLKIAIFGKNREFLAKNEVKDIFLEKIQFFKEKTRKKIFFFDFS